MFETIFVRPTNQAQPQHILAFVMADEPPGGGERVVLFERHSAHPGGEVFITTGSGATEVARTQRVADLLASGVLEVVHVGRK